MAVFRQAHLDALTRSLARLLTQGLEQADALLPPEVPRQRVLAQARYHGVLPLIAARVDTSSVPALDWLMEAARAAARAEVAIDLGRQPRVIVAVEALARAGVAPIVLKGEALAHTHYAASWQRPRTDTDLLVAPGTEPAARAALEALGYRRAVQLPGRWVSSQASYRSAGPSGFAHVIDLHWQINNSPVLSRPLTHADIVATARPLPALGPAARAPSAVHALLLACLHRVGSEYAPFVVDGIARLGGDRLIWLADIDRLVHALDDERAEFAQLALRHGAGHLCAAGIATAATAFATPGATELVRALTGQPADSLPDRYLRAGPPGRAWLDFRALPGLRARLGFLRESLWPNAAYLRARYPDQQGSPLWQLRLARIIRGLAARLR